MQMVKRFFGGFFLIIILLWLFSPKQELYYFLEKALKEKHVIISNETVKDTWIGLKIDHADIYVEGAKVATNRELNFIFLFLYAQLSLKDLELDESLHSVAPKNIESFSATYSVLDPLNVILEGNGSVGEVAGTVALKDRKIEVLFPKPKDLTTVKKFLKKDAKKGWYYEKTY